MQRVRSLTTCRKLLRNYSGLTKRTDALIDDSNLLIARYAVVDQSTGDASAKKSAPSNTSPSSDDKGVSHSQGCKPLPPKCSAPPPPPGSNNNPLYFLLGAIGLGGLGYYTYNNNLNKQNEAQVKDVCPVIKNEKNYDNEPVTICPPKASCPELKTSDQLQNKDAQSGYPDLEKCPDLPSHAQYLIIGAGTSAWAAFRAIRANDPKAKVLVVGEECNLPYMRPPLSKELWFNTSRALTEKLRYKRWNDKERSIFFEKDCFYTTPKELAQKECGGVAVALGKKVEKLDIENSKVVLDNNWEITYDKVLIATGGKPRQHPVIANASAEVKKRTILFRKIVDFEKLDCISLRNKDVAIIGGGFLGSELAVALGHRITKLKSSAKVFQIFPEKGNMGKILPEYLSKWTMNKVQEHNVNVLKETNLRCARMCGDKVELVLSDDKTLLVDHVVVAVGLEPNVSIAECAGLEIDKEQGGYLVNAEMNARDNVWVAGDAASFYDVKLGRRRIEHHDHAVVSGRLAGENMSGPGKAYWHQSMFWSDLGPNLGFEAIGIVDNNLETSAVFAKATEGDSPKAVVEETGENMRSETEKEECVKKRLAKAPTKPAPAKGDEDFGKGIVFYIKDKVIVGMLMWNVFGKMPLARKILKEQKQYDDLTQVAKMFEIHVPEEKPEDEANKAQDKVKKTEKKSS